MFSDSRWWYTYVVSVSFPDGDAALLAPYAQLMLSADLPNRAARCGRQLIERLGAHSLSCLQVSSACGTSACVSLIIIDRIVEKEIGKSQIEAAGWMCRDTKLFFFFFCRWSAWPWRPRSSQLCRALTFCTAYTSSRNRFFFFRIEEVRAYF